jgi:hypothetical protein
MDYNDFYKLFCKAIFKQVVMEMLKEIEHLSIISDTQELPLQVKLDSYCRYMMLQGLDQEATENNEQGEAILDAVSKYRRLECPETLRKEDFESFMADPF